MKVLKGFALGLLSFLLFISLSALGLAIMINQTVLNPGFVIAEIDKINAFPLAKEILLAQFPIPKNDAYIAPAVNKTLTDIEPWLKEQLKTAVYAGYDYIKGKTSKLEIVIPAGQIKPMLKQNLWETFQRNPPPEAASIPPAQLRQYFDQMVEPLITSFLPDRIVIDESMLASFSPDAVETMASVRLYVGYFDLALKLLIVLTILFIAGIVLINRQVKASTRELGIIFATYGALEYAGIYVFRYLAGMQIAQIGIPPELQPVIPRVIADVLTPLQIFSLAALATGAVLIIVSFVYKPRPASI